LRVLLQRLFTRASSQTIIIFAILCSFNHFQSQIIV
jgi:hypothetical protein